MKKIIVITLILISNICYGQAINANFKCGCTDGTKLIIDKLHSLTNTVENNFVEFRVYANDSIQPEKFIQYMKLCDKASEAELISILENGSQYLSNATWGYVYMAYAFRCDKEKRKEKPITLYNKSFIPVKNGFEVQEMPFLKFKSFCRIDGKYNPHAKQ